MTTRDKRASVLGLGLAALLVLPAPGAIDQPDRQQLAYSYRGITASAADIAALDVINATCQVTGTIAATLQTTGTITAEWG